MVAMLAALASIAAGVAVTFGLSQVFPTINDVRQLKEVIGRPVLGSISMVVSPLISDQVHKSNRLFAVVVVLFLLANAGWIVVVKQQLLP
jgi:hypothetical protein